MNGPTPGSSRWVVLLAAVCLPWTLQGCPDPAGSDWTQAMALGLPCTADQECGAAVCFPAQDQEGFTGWTDGICAAPCLAGACPDESTCTALASEAWCLPACEGSADCRTGYVCNVETGSCLPDCTLGWDCGEGFTCTADGTCEYQWPDLRPLGGPCMGPADCQSGWCLPQVKDDEPTGWTGGLCTIPCKDGLCSDGLQCVLLDTQPFCLPGCAGDGDCRPGYLCDPPLKACLPDCRLGWDCGEGFVCMDTGLCDFDWPDLTPAGGPCQVSPDCQSGWCLPPVSDGQPTGWTDGTCTLPCSGGQCLDGLVCVTLDGQPFCLTRCQDESQCREDYVCLPDFEACLPDCRLGWECSEYYECNEIGHCVPNPLENPCSLSLNPQCAPTPCLSLGDQPGTCAPQPGGCGCVPGVPPQNPCSHETNPQCVPDVCTLFDGNPGQCGWQFGQCVCRPDGPPGGNP